MKKFDVFTAVIVYPAALVLNFVVIIVSAVIIAIIKLHEIVWSGAKEYAKDINHVDSLLLTTVSNLGTL